MDTDRIVKDLYTQGIIESKDAVYEPLSGGTTSTIGLLRDGSRKQWVLKFNEPNVIHAEAEFLNEYENIPFLPRLVYKDPEDRFIVYPFLAGTTDSSGTDKTNILSSLVQHVLNYYQPFSEANGWGYRDDLKHSREQFLEDEICSVKEIIHSGLLEKKDYELIAELAKLRSQSKESELTYLLHGDCGYHNFLFSEQELSGLIDPQTFIGHPLHDLVFAFCSTANELTQETIIPAAKQLKMWNYDEQVLNEEVLLGLFTRLARSSQHHPADLPEYLKAWEKWKVLVSPA
ncbi:aminoglycoside phosphotransferase family protein [Fictibacillus sp. WQ 8-8]|uniref:phosphotransferase family protein n=1 Tax=Fictibacillus sp. WQ 8-8 TaxID=2938788 RepID=UPI00210E9BB2|nr:phosphotransferase [Fictibacillus sp. WQ 8-8]MCQ6265088.1 aminoglycoside phosphotransferase family protein [Fictibacillus sp. WQ 8-8]